MRYCKFCGAEVSADSAYCHKCGNKIAEGNTSGNADSSDNVSASTYKVSRYNESTYQVAYVFMIIGTVIGGLLLLPLAWCIPMTVAYKNAHDRGEEASMALKVCALLFVSLIGGIAMLFDHDN